MPLSSAIRATVGILLVVPFLSGCGALGFIFVEGPAPGWQDASAEDLPSMAIQQPCTDSKVLPRLDAVSAVVNGLFGIIGLFASNTFKADETIRGTGTMLDGWTVLAQNDDDRALMYQSIASLVWTPISAFSAVKGRNRVNDCRAFNVRLSEEQRRGAQAQSSYKWLDEFSSAPDFGADPPDLPVAIPSLRWFDQLFPAPDFGANAFDPVFRGAISNSPEQ